MKIFSFWLICAAAFSGSGSANAEEGRTRVLVSDFGYDAQDSTQAIQKAIDSGAEIVVLDRQAGPWISNALNLRGDLELVLEEGVELQAKPGEFMRRGEVLLSASNTKNLTIRGEGKGATIRMHKRDYWAAPYEKSEWRHGIALLSAENVLIENLQIAETGGDGIYVGVSGATKNPCRNVTIRKVDCVENNRQGISVISVDGLLIEDCVLRDTNGTPPAAGIDFEPNGENEQITNAVLRRVVSINNDGDGYSFYLPQLRQRGHELSFTMEDCHAVRNAGIGLNITVANGEDKVLDGAMLVKDSRFVGNHVGVAIRSKWAVGAPLTLENVTIETIAADLAQGRASYAGVSSNPDYPKKLDQWSKTTTDSGISLIATGDDEYPNGGMTLKNVRLVDASDVFNQSKPFLLLRDASARGVGFADLHGELVSENIKNKDEVKIATTSFTTDALVTLYPSLNARRVPAWDLELLNKPEGRAVSDELVAAWRERMKKDDFKPEPMAMRGGAEFWIYADANETATATFRQRVIGEYEPVPVVMTVVSPDGTEASFENGFAIDRPCTVEIKSPVAGWRRIDAEFGSSTLELEDSNAPVFFSTRPKLDAYRSDGRYEFYVPKNTKDLGLRIVGSAAEPVSLRVFDPDGKEVSAILDNPALGVWNVELDDAGEPVPPKSGFWSIQFEQPSEGALENYILTIYGVPALMR